MTGSGGFEVACEGHNTVSKVKKSDNPISLPLTIRETLIIQ